MMAFNTSLKYIEDMKECGPTACLQWSVVAVWIATNNESISTAAVWLSICVGILCCERAVQFKPLKFNSYPYTEVVG